MECDADWAQLVCSTDIFSDPIKINKNIYIIGRSKDCDFIINDNEYVSSKHCQIIRESGSIFLTDTSTNGTKINDNLKISKKKVSLNHGDEINIVDQSIDSEKNISFVFQELSKLKGSFSSNTSNSSVELNQTIALDVNCDLLGMETNIQTKRKHSEINDEDVCVKKNNCIYPNYCLPSISNNTPNQSTESLLLNPSESEFIIKDMYNDKDNEDNDLLESLCCSICLEIFYKCISLQPCMHSFCSGCYSEWMDLSNNCPTCKCKVEQINRNHLLNNLVEIYLNKHPDRKRDEDDKMKLDLKNKITADMLNMKKEKRTSNFDDEDYENNDDESDNDLQILNFANDLPVYHFQQAQTICRQCPAPNNAQLNRQGSYTCNLNENHILCQCCMQPMPDRTHIIDNLSTAQSCSICHTFYCHLYWTCRNRSCRGCLAEFQDMSLNFQDIKDIILKNQFESDILKSYLVANNMDANHLLATCYNKLMEGNFTCPDQAKIQNAEPFCRKCFFKNFSHLAYAYRAEIPQQDINKLVRVRPDCHWGYECRTQITKPMHAANFNHICVRIKFN